MRQQRDFSCGVAALATLLTYYFHDPVSESGLLDVLLGELSDLESITADGVSFANLRTLAHRRGYAALGVAVDYRDLAKLGQPVIVALRVNGRAHFSVLRGVSADGTVYLADPSWGNRRLSAWAFRTLFVRDTREATGAQDWRKSRSRAGIEPTHGHVLVLSSPEYEAPSDFPRTLPLAVRIPPVFVSGGRGFP